MTQYDYLILGAGPTGLTLAYVLGSIGKKCLVVDASSSLGGCHRVTRVDGLFTEHGPRIYSQAYKTTGALLETMGISLSELFTPYHFSISNIGGKGLANLRPIELAWLGLEFARLLFHPNHGKTTSMNQFMDCKGFREGSRDYIDRLCRLTDGAGAEAYTLHEFLQLANQQASYQLLQPRLPNDKGLWKVWKDALDRTGNITLQLSTRALSLETQGETIISLVTDKGKFSASQYLLTIPPLALVSLLSSSPEPVQFAFGSLEQLKLWATGNSYITDIPVIFHWDTKLALPKVWGFPESAWGIAFIVLSDYMSFEDPRSQTVISTCITRTDKAGSKGKTVNQSSKEELLAEVFFQLSSSFSLPSATFSLLSPTVRFTGDRWVDSDSAYVATNLAQPLCASGNISNLFNVGMQNNHNIYAFTSLEGAVTNALHFSHRIEPETRRFKIQGLTTVISILKILLFICLLIVLTVILSKLFSGQGRH